MHAHIRMPSPHMRWRLAPWHWAAVLSVAVHGLLLLALPTSPSPHPASAARAASLFTVSLRPSASVPMQALGRQQMTPFASGDTHPSDSASQRQATWPALAQTSAAHAGSLYLPASDLSVKPRFLHHKSPPGAMQVPDVLAAPVPIRLRINEQGDVDRVMLGEVQLSAQAQVLIQASFQNMQFSPGMLGTIPVKSELVVEIQLEPSLSSLDL